MKNLTTIAFAGLMSLGLAGHAAAETFVKGVVKKIEAPAGKVTIIHEELVDLGMPAMTMVFRVAEPEMLESLSEGKEILFVAERVNGKLTVTKVQ